jgi:predicted PhzF superfamily epimerase YddE/YHI9
MKIKQYQVDVFATKAFEGIPVAVCPLESWLDDVLLQAIAEENNLSATAFFVASGKSSEFEIRWFTPGKEVDDCYHAALAAAHVIFKALGYAKDVIIFNTRSYYLHVERAGYVLLMDLPAYPPLPCELSDVLAEGLGQRPVEVLAAKDYIAVFDSEATVRAIAPNLALLSQLDLRGVIITAPGLDVDFVSRFFVPKLGIPEGPATCSAHCELAPYWAKKLDKVFLRSTQVSKREGNISCKVEDDRVVLFGSAVTFMEAEITF